MTAGGLSAIKFEQCLFLSDAYTHLRSTSVFSQKLWALYSVNLLTCYFPNFNHPLFRENY